MIPITRPHRPNLTTYYRHLDGVFDRNWLTNGGPLYQELTARLSDYLGVRNLLLVANGTVALELAYRLGRLTGPVLTTPYTFAATPGSLSWLSCQPLFADVDRATLNLDATEISEQRLLEQGISGVVGVHVFGNPCPVELLQAACTKAKVPLIFDAAHCFGVNYKGKSLLNYGDISTISFHATKLFHTVEGGALIIKDNELFEEAKRLINFGFDSQNVPQEAGINAKMSEVHAAMGLAVLDDIDDILETRMAMKARYQDKLNGAVEFQRWSSEATDNGAYCPVLLESEEQLLKVVDTLAGHSIQSRRYFWPSLSQMACYGGAEHTPIADDLAKRSLCLPMHSSLTAADVDKVCETLKSALTTS